MERKQIPIVVAVIKNKEGKLLVAKRNEPEIPEAHNKWEFIGGHIEFLETPEDAVIREVKEESGLEVKIIRLLPKIFNNHWVTKNGKELQVLLICFECEVVGGQLHTESLDAKISELKFIDISELKNLDTLHLTNETAELLNT